MENPLDRTILVLTSTCGAVAFLENAVMFCFIVSLLKKYSSLREQYDFIIQILFVCVNDVLSSFVLFWTGVLRVTGEISAYLCVFTITLSSHLQTMSLFNITCICAFRYCIARNIRNTGAIRQSKTVLILTCVNLLVGITGMASTWLTMKIRSIPEGTNIACEFGTVVTSQVTYLLSTIHFMMLFVCLVISDVLCVMTIFRLKRELNVVESTSGAVSTVGVTTIATTEISNSLAPTAISTKSTALTTVVSKSTGLVQNSRGAPGKRNVVKFGQQSAIVTVLLILTFFNLSVCPIMFGTLAMLNGVDVPLDARRITFLALFLNSMFNPIVIAFRFQDIRRLLTQWRRNLKKYMYCC